jgi:anaerobic selenocysteine-containing dehydrogenase
VETRIGVCNLCEAICGLQLGVEGDRVVSVRGNREDPLSRGHICPKALALPDIHADPDRLTRPVRRTANGWREVTWDDAFDEVATRLAGVQRAHGRDALAVYLGNPNVHSLGALTHGPALLRQLGTRNRYSATSVDQLPHQLIAWLLYGHQLLLPVPDIDRTDYLLLFGSNPMASNGSLMTVPDFPGRVRELKARGGRLVVFDPRRTETARVAAAHHFIRPGTDAVVLLAMAHAILADGLGSGLRDLAGYVDGLDDVRAHLAAFTPEAAADVSGVPADIIRAVAADFAAARAAAVHGRVGLSTQRFGTVCQWAVQLLLIITGNLDRPGGAMFTHPAIDVVGRRLAGRGHLGRWSSRVRGLPEFAGELPVATLADEILTPGEGQVRAVLTVAGNPVLSTPNGARLADALRGLEFMAAVDYYVNETTRHADVILPPTGAFERDHYDLVFHLLAVRDTARFTPAVLDPAPGARHDWEIYRELGIRHRRATRTAARKRPTAATVKARLEQEVRLRTSPTRLVGLLLATGRTGVTLRRLRANPAGVDLGPLRPSLPERLQTKDRRIDVAPAVVLDDLARVRNELLGDGRPVPTSDVPLQLIGRRHQRDCNSWMHNTTRLTKGRPRHQLLMHPDDLSARGLTDGQAVAVVSRVGRVVVDVVASADMMPGVVSLPHGYGHASDGVLLANAVQVPGVSINDLTDPEEIDELSGNAAFSGLPVSVRPIDGAGS